MSFRVAAGLLLAVLSGMAAARDIPAPIAAQGTAQIAFTPQDDAEGMIVAAIKSAHKQVLVQSYSFTSRKIASALIAAKARGIDVQVLADREQVFGSNRGNARSEASDTRIPELAVAGIPVMLEVRYVAAHNKVMVIDAGLPDAAVITGSYNWTYAAQNKNAENVIILRGNLQLVRAYQENWQRHHADALPYAATR